MKALFDIVILSLLISIDPSSATSDIDISNPLIDYQKCSHGDEEWRICLYKSGGAGYYCPSVPQYDFLEMMTIHASYLDLHNGGINGTTECFTCSDIETDCSSFVSGFLENKNISQDLSTGDRYGWEDDFWDTIIIYDKMLEGCQKLCEGGKDAEECSINDPCTPGTHFCDFSSNEEGAQGTCKACPLDIDECYIDGFATSVQGKINCHDCRMDCRNVAGTPTVTINEKEYNAYSADYSIQKSSQDVSGPLIDCSNLLLVNEFECPGAQDHVCLFDTSLINHEDIESRTAWDLYEQSKNNGCIAIVVAGFWFDFDYANMSFPYVQLFENETLQDMLGEEAQVKTQVVGTECYVSAYYTECTSSGLSCGDKEYCDYGAIQVDGMYTEGQCFDCPTFDNGEPNPAGCFFAQGKISYDWYNPEIVKSCATSCNASLASGKCKFCPKEVSVVDFGVEDKADQCYFCPSNDMQYPERDVPLFGENITCDKVYAFFNRLEVHKDSQNCRLAQSVNYICGCEGTGYAGANTEAKQKSLVWMPRVSGILSLMGSIFIIYDTLRTRKKRKKIPNQILSTLSAFDIFGSIAYALTTLPTPTEDYLYGSKGNENTCVTQGFFIQIGTIACYLNVSLAIYYHLTIINDWPEAKFWNTHLAHVLFAAPIIVGLAFSFAGIPYYDNVVVWCNNSAK